MINNTFIFWVLLAAINLVAFILVGADKKRSVYDERRVPEVYLFFIAIFFASLGVFLGMYYFHHKTKKLYFPVGLGLLIAEQAALLFFAFQKLS